MLGVADWNTLSAMSRESSNTPTDAEEKGGAVYPAIPIRDVVLLPAIQLPLWLKRERTLAALAAAFKARREVVLVTQRSAEIDEPSEGDVYQVGTLARILDMSSPNEDALTARPELAGTTEVLVQPFKRVKLLSFTGADGAYRARVQEPDEGPIVSAPDRVRAAASIFERVAGARGIGLPANWRTKLRLGDPGRFADLLGVSAPITLAQRQELLETFEPVARLDRLIAMIED
jgi:ATP-dependent Lon protease